MRNDPTADQQQTLAEGGSIASPAWPGTLQTTVRRPPEDDRPRGELGRMVGIDFARFLAIVGMMCAHLMPPLGIPGHVAWLSAIVDGNASTLFAVIGGVSVVLATRSYLERGYLSAARWAMAVRGLLVIILGATLALAPGDIVVVLVYFGTAMLCSIPFLRASPKLLLGSAAVLAVAGPFANASVRSTLQLVGEGGGVSWMQFAEPVVLARAVLLTGTYPVVTWIAYLLVGMAIAKLLIASRRNGSEARFIAWAAGLGVLLTVASLSISAAVYEFGGRAAMAEAIPEVPADQLDALAQSPGFGGPLGSEWWGLALQTPHTGTTLDILRGIGVALIVIAGMLWLARILPKPVLRTLEPLRAAGAAPLTVYTLHIVAAAVASVLAGTLMGGNTTTIDIPWWYFGMGILAIHVLGAVAIGALLATLRRRGPLETLVSSASATVALRLTR